MGESAEMVALMRANAEMILNTAKEAAARVMESEMKARYIEKDLISTREEAARMLLRLKEILDAKTAEAEITSLNQQRKIDELESQLDEAERIILDLRAELTQTQEELDEVKKENVHILGMNKIAEVSCCNDKMPKDKLFSTELFTSPLNPQPKLVSPGVKSRDLDLSTLEHKFCSSVKENAKQNSEHDICCVADPALASIIITGKEPELYRNGCTQRIRAILVDEKLPSGNDSHSPIDSEPVLKTSETDVQLSTPSSKIEKLEMMQNFSIGVKNQSVKFCTMRKKKSQYVKAKARSHKQCYCQHLKPLQTHLAVSRRRRHSCGGNDFSHTSTNNENIKNVENFCGSEGKVNLDKNQDVFVLRRSIRNRNPKYWSDVITSCRYSQRFKRSYQPFSYLSYSNSKKVKCSVKSGDNQLSTEDKTKAKGFDHIAGFPSRESKCPNLSENDVELDMVVNLEEHAAQREWGSFSQINCNLADAKNKTGEFDHAAAFPNREPGCPENLPENDLELTDVLVNVDEHALQLVLGSLSQINCNFADAKNKAGVFDHAAGFPKRESRCPEILPENDTELIDVVVNLDKHALQLELGSLSKINCNLANTITTVTLQGDSKRLTRYSLRKQKAESLANHEEICCYGESSLKKRFQENENSSSGVQNSSLMKKSSRTRSSRRLLQVARQVVSFSGKRE